MPYIEYRVRWVPDPEPYDSGDMDKCEAHAAERATVMGCDDCAERSREVWAYVAAYGVYGCIIEKCCECCGEWSHASSLWSIVGDDEDHREIEAELLQDAMAGVA